MLVTFVEPTSPSGGEPRTVSQQRMASSPRCGEIVSVQEDLGGNRFAWRVKEIIYKLPDLGPVDGLEIDECVAVIVRIVSPGDLARTVTQIAIPKGPVQPPLPFGRNA